jgi:hypothetical protein
MRFQSRFRWWQWMVLSAVFIAACLAMWIRFERRNNSAQN